MSFSLFTSLAINGIAMSVIYALLGMGLILLVRAVGILNFAQGDLMMFGAYIAACLLLDVQLPMGLMLIDGVGVWAIWWTTGLTWAVSAAACMLRYLSWRSAKARGVPQAA